MITVKVMTFTDQQKATENNLLLKLDLKPETLSAILISSGRILISSGTFFFVAKWSIKMT